MIGWYVHDHGSGHRRRLEAVAAHLRVPVTGMGSGTPAAGVEWLPLPTDASQPPGHEPLDPTAGGALHWAPVGEPGLVGRAEALAGWVRASGCRVLVVDVSVEMLLLGRLLGLATVAVVQPGARDDRAHRLGYDTASALLAPFPRPSARRLLDRSRGPRAARTTFAGGFSGDDGRPPAPRPLACVGRRCVALVLGRGGHQVTAPDVRAAAAATPGWHWHVAGRLVDDEPVGADPTVVTEHGLLADAWSLLSRVDVVVGPSGGGLVADVAAAGVPLLALPQPRPFEEQVALARLLPRNGCALVVDVWPRPRQWVGLLERLAAHGPDAPLGWQDWSDGLGAARAARLVERVHTSVAAARTPSVTA